VPQPLDPTDVRSAIVDDGDAQHAFRLFLARDCPDPVSLKRIADLARTPRRLRVYITESPEFDSKERRQRARRIATTPEGVQLFLRYAAQRDVSLAEAETITRYHPHLASLHEAYLLGPDAEAFAAALEPKSGPLAVHGYFKSMTRSGHHLLVDLLTHYYGTELNYCEFYGPRPGCCHKLPCTRGYEPADRNRIFLQKSHDHALDDPVDLPGPHIIQFRNPIARLQSSYEHRLLHPSVVREDSVEHFRDHARESVKQSIGFWKKWLAAPRDHWLPVEYTSLVADTAEVLHSVLRCLEPGVQPDPQRLQRAAAASSRPTANANQLADLVKDGSEFRVRKIQAHRYYDAGFLYELEQHFFDSCPGFPTEPMIPKPGGG